MAPPSQGITKVTIGKIPEYPNVRIKDEIADRSTTWKAFLRQRHVNLDPMYYIVYNKTRKLHATLNEPISQLINKFRRKASITVTVVKLQAPNPTFSPPMNVQQQNGTRRLSVPNPIRSASGSRFPEDELHLNVDEEEALGNAGGYNNENDDAMSMLSQDDEEDDGTGSIIKQQFRMAVDRLPASHFRAFKEELIRLKSGEGRDYKWSHYAPRTSSFVISALKL